MGKKILYIDNAQSGNETKSEIIAEDYGTPRKLTHENFHTNFV